MRESVRDSVGLCAGFCAEPVRDLCRTMQDSVAWDAQIEERLCARL